MAVQPVLIDGEWVTSAGTETFQAVNPATTEPLPDEFPVSPWGEVERALQAAAGAAREMRGWPGERFAAFLHAYADRIDKRSDELSDLANQETALPVAPRS